MAANPQRIQVTTLAKDLLRVSFNIDVAVTPELLDLTNYSITAVDPVTSSDAQVLSVLGMDFSDTSSTDFIDLQVSNTEQGTLYRIVISNLLDPDEDTLTDGAGGGVQGEFRSRLTKADSMLMGIPPLYDTSVTSTLKQLILAIAVRDEEIGGGEEEPSTPLY
jgi:hypothetical protein